ncbi:MAG: amino acid adenylation domain-containing protein [Saccharofermentans sp.]|nr:amino acid adenylation domain-containing protein [Saccharofermentans sp.]
MNEYINLFCEAQKKYAKEIAIVDHDGTRSVDYETFGDMMLRTASWIYSMHLGDRSFIPVRFDSSMEFAASVCGVWLSGHVAVPVGKSFPEERVKYICMNCDAPFIIDDYAAEEIKNTAILDTSVFPETENKDAAILLYTSGSTGMPKGILHSFAGLIANRNMGNKAIYSTGQVWAMGAPFYFVASVAVYKVLTYGGCVHLMDEDTMRDVRKLEDYYESNKITVGFISPSVLSNFNNRSETLKLVMTGSERLTGQCSRDGYKLYNNYGMSETMGTVCSFLVDKPYETTPVGIPAEGTDWALFDDDMNPVPDGEEGEYCTRGAYTMGYFKDPEATAKLFKGGWLHTGDILKKLPDGNLVYINRKDWMVKINGQRVEPGEIENVLRTVPGVDKAVVKAIKGTGDQVFLCAYYTGKQIDNTEFSAILSEKLAPYMIPGFYYYLDELPLNQNGKIDRKNLPEPDFLSRKAEYAPPQNDTEALLCRAFESALGVDQVGIDDDFFALGGDSIRVMKLSSQCPELDLDSKLIYSAKTPRAIAKACLERGTAKTRVKKDEYPLSGSQIGIYIESINRDGEAVYNNPILLKLSDNIDIERLRSACEAFVEAHPYIKVGFKTDSDGNPIQYRRDNESYSQTIEKITEKEFKELVPTLKQPFRLHSDRLFRIRLFETEEGKYLFTDFHHIIFDGASMLIMIKDLEKAYNGGNVEAETYSGFEAAEDEKDKREAFYEDAKTWYLDTFGGLEVDSLPIPDRKESDRSFGIVTKDLELEVSEVEALCKRCGVTENILAVASFGICAGLYAGMNEALFSTIYNGRDSLRTTGTIAMLVKTLPVYTKFEKDQKIRDYLTASKEQMLGCMNNDIYPFSELVADTGMTSELLFVYQGDVLNVGGFAGEPVERIPIMDNATGEQLTIQMYKQSGSYNIRAEYRSDLYSEEFIEILLRSYENVLKKMLVAETVGEISLAGYEELKKLEEWNKTETDYDRTQTVVSLFRSASQKYPDNIAVIYEDEQCSYSKVDRISDNIAAFIESSGIKKGSVVSILIPRGIYQVTASLGALKAGCAYQPLDTTYPTERLNFMIQDASADLLITTEELGGIITDYEGKILYLSEIENLQDGKPETQCDPDDIFILLYTSGSTGVPKGVRLTHGNLVCFINWYIKFYELTQSDRVGQYASYGFDACMMDMYPALSAGAAVCIVPEEMRLDLAAMSEYFLGHGVSLAFLTTQVGRQFITEIKTPGIRAISVGGEKLASMEPPKGVEFYNCYGPTECTIFSTIYRVAKKEDNIPIGHALSDLKLYVVDAFGHLLPPGALGELIIAGPHVGEGYLNRPEKTAEVFIDNPFDDGEYKKAYRSGDIVRFRTDGEIEFIGRCDGQVKIHGFRVELSEVEAVIRQIDDLRDVAVVTKDLGADGKAIAAYIVSDKKIDPKEIAEYIRVRKPPYMIPASIMQIDKIPLNQNGKVNKKALPEPVISAIDEDTSHVDNVLEKELKSIIGEALNMENPPLNTPLEYLGFTSLSMIRLSTRLFKRFDIDIPVKQIKDISITGIEDIILENWMNGSNVRTVTETGTEEDSMPLSAAQSGVYVDCMKNPDAATYNIPSVLTFEKNVDPENLKDSICRVLKAHPSIFVHFDIGDRQVMSIKDEMIMPDIPVFEKSPEECERFKVDFVKPFHLNKGPLFRFTIVKTPDDVRVYSDFHHLVFDGFSMNEFLKELGIALKNDGADLEKENSSYFSYVKNQKKMLSGDKGAEYEEYFSKLLNEYESSTELPSDVTKGDKSGKKKFAYICVDENTVSRACRDGGITEPGFFLAALEYTLARVSVSDRIYIATISSGRSDIRFADTFGMFVNTLPLAAKLTDGSINDFVRDVSADLEKALEHENYPFADVVGKWGFSVNVMYEYQRNVVEKPDIPGFVKVEGIETGEAKFGITVRIIDRDSSPAIEVEYNDASYSDKAIGEFLKSYAIVLDKFAKNGRGKLREVTLLDKEREEILNTYHSRNDKTDIDADILFHTGIEKNAELRPDHMAITAVDGDYTYRQLDENANRVANALIERGINAGSRIVILLQRTAKLFFAIYGTLKSGCAYIPCDPNYPVERIRQIIDDSHAQLIITTADRLGKFKNSIAVDIEDLLKNQNTDKPMVEITQDDLAYLIYTSGSTGKPKGVMLKHRGIVNYVTDSKDNILIHAMAEHGHVLTAVTTISFDFSIKEWGAPLFNGLTLSVAADDEINDAGKLAARMKATGTDIFGSTPSRLQTLMESEEFREVLDDCKILINGGEKYPEQLLNTLKKVKGRLLFNTYGPTEITVSSNTQELSGYDTVNVGRPLPGVVEYIVDSDGNEVPPGVTGELYIGGIGVAAGYNNLPEMTAERFIMYKGIRTYKSGDFARWLENGDVEILGRRDNQIKLRGLRIELDEVDAVLASVSGIGRTAVKIEKINGIEHLCAWFTADHAVDIGELKKELGRTLTNYMVPTAYMQLEEMPVTPNGKLDLKNLPLPELYRSDSFAAPQTSAEKDFSDIFGKLLHVDNVGATENFFDLGGTSLLVTNVVIAAYKLDYHIAFSDVFDNPTPRALAGLAGGGTDSLACPRPEPENKEISEYDYSAINELLSANTLESFKTGDMRPLGNVLLTGATGYLGIHVLNELIKSCSGKIYCLLRPKGGKPAESRLDKQFFYYFNADLIELLGDRLIIVNGDVTDREALSSLEDKNINTVINCAAVVKHFASGTLIEDVNVGGARNLVDFCLKTNAAMIQTSTMSVVTAIYKDNLPDGFKADERSLYFNQLLDNKYIHSKFLAERLVLEAVATKGLRGKVMRFGNLSARHSDGEFQINFKTNSAMGRLKAFAMLGCASYDQLDNTMEFSPIDSVAKAVIELSKTPDKCTIFHVFNNQNISMEGIFHELRSLGYDIKYVEREEFGKAFALAQSDPDKASTLTSIMAYMQIPGTRETVRLPRNCEFTMQVLYRMGFAWPVTSWDYIERFVSALSGLGYFDVEKDE